MSLDAKLTVLKIKGGHFVMLQWPRDQPQLCAVTLQSSRTRNVHIVTRKVQNKKQMALEFSHKNGKYFVKVEKEKLMVERTDRNSLTDKHWFEKFDLHSGTYYGLRSVANPSQYLSKYYEGQKTIFCTYPSEDGCAEFED